MSRNERIATVFVRANAFLAVRVDGQLMEVRFLLLFASTSTLYSPVVLGLLVVAVWRLECRAPTIVAVHAVGQL